MSFQDLWNKFPLIFGQLCDKKTCAFVVMRIGKKVENSINFSVYSLNFVPGLQYAYCTDRIGISVFVRASLESGLKYWSWKKILVRLSWPLWSICGLHVEEPTRKSTMMLHWVVTVCVCWKEPATGPLGVNISASRLKLHFQKFGNVIWGYYLY